MTIWSPALDRDAGPLYLSIADAIAEAVAAGELAAGEKLPTHRQLAADLEVTVGTVSRAYSEAERRGLVRGEVGRGTFVRAYAEGGDGVGGFPPGAVDGRRFVDLGFNAPAPVEGRAESRDLARALNEIAAAPRLGCFLDY